MVDWPNQLVSLVGTLVAVFLGALSAWRIARWQLAAERRAQEAQDQQHLMLSLELVVRELRDGEQSARLLFDVAADAGMDVCAWEYYEAIADSVRSETYSSLVRAGSLRRLPPDVKRLLEEAFGALRTIATGTLVSRTRYNYERTSRTGGDVKAALEIFRRVKQAAQDGLTSIPQARAALEGWLGAQKDRPAADEH